MDKQTRLKIKKMVSDIMNTLVDHPLYSDSIKLQELEQKIYDIYIEIAKEEINE